jgi:hypothetical protein
MAILDMDRPAGRDDVAGRQPSTLEELGLGVFVFSQYRERPALSLCAADRV